GGARHLPAGPRALPRCDSVGPRPTHAGAAGGAAPDAISLAPPPQPRREPRGAAPLARHPRLLAAVGGPAPPPVGGRPPRERRPSSPLGRRGGSGASSWAQLAAAGGCFGLAFYSYLPARLLPLVAVALVGHLAWSRPHWLRARWRGLGLAAGVAALVAAPLAGHYAAHWSAFVFRVDMVSLTNPWVNAGDPWGLLWHNLQGTAGMFAVRGDADPQYNVAARPVFTLPLAALFALGLGVVVARWRQPAYW